MARDGLDDLARDLLAASQNISNGKFSKAFLRKEGKKLTKKTLNTAKARVNKKTGNLFKGIKTGKVYKFGGRDGALSIRAYGGSPSNHIHLLNSGHIIVDRAGNERGFKEGLHFFDDAAKEFEGEYVEDCEVFIDKMLDKHGL